AFDFLHVCQECERIGFADLIGEFGYKAAKAACAKFQTAHCTVTTTEAVAAGYARKMSAAHDRKSTMIDAATFKDSGCK
uniref:hypothetical protein n=1 Tax=Klebsiella pneumoniae TaxID=573 RepID=UPI00195425F9